MKIPAVSSSSIVVANYSLSFPLHFWIDILMKEFSSLYIICAIVDLHILIMFSESIIVIVYFDAHIAPNLDNGCPFKLVLNILKFYIYW